MMPYRGAEKSFRTHCAASACFSHYIDSLNYSGMR